MRIAIRLTPLGDGQWHWSLGRGGMERGWGNAESYEEARTAAEKAAVAFAEDSKRTTFYLYDTTTGQRTEAKEG